LRRVAQWRSHGRHRWPRREEFADRTGLIVDTADLARHLVDHQHANGDAGAVLGIAALVQTERQDDPRAFEGAAEGFFVPGRGREPVGHDRNDPAARQQMIERGAQVPGGGVLIFPARLRHRERRVHHNHARPHAEPENPQAACWVLLSGLP
jgi:hypothetical protein